MQEPLAEVNFKFTLNQLLVKLAVLNKIDAHNNELERDTAEQDENYELSSFTISRSFLT